MSVTEHTPISPFTGDGSTTTVAFAWPILAAADMKVKIDGVELALDVDFTVDIVARTVTFATAPASGAAGVLYRVSVLSRATDYQTAGDFRAAVVNPDFDRLWLVFNEILNGSRGSPSVVRAPAGETLDELPAAADRLGKVLSFHPTTGEPMVSTPTAGDATSVLNTLAADGGAGLVGYNPAEPYGGGVGAAINALTAFLDVRHARSAAEVSAGVTPANTAYLPLDVRRYGGAFDGSTVQTPMSSALSVADETVSSAQGNRVDIPQGTGTVSATLNIPNRVAIVGVNKRGSVLKAAAGHSGSYMLTADNGTSSMFDSQLERLTLDCNDIAGLGGVLSDAWQEGGGLRDVLITKFRTYGVRFQNGDGGAALCEISQSEIFGSPVAAGTAGIRVDQISAIGSFMLKVRDSTIAGGTGFPLPRGIDIVNDSLHAQNVHFETVTSGIYLDGVGHHVLIGVTGGPDVTNVVEIAATFTGSLFMIGCHRAGATNLLKDNRSGGLGTISSLDFPLMLPGSGAVIYGPGQTNSCGVFDGTGATPAVTNCYGVSGISRTATGTYTVTESRSRQTAHCAVNASCNLAGGVVTVDLIGANTFQLRTYNASNALADCNEVKFTNARVA